MWRFVTKRHLHYPSVEAWFKGEGLTEPLIRIADPVEREYRIKQYADLRRHLFAKHIKTLSREEQRQFREGSHPSQQHRFAKRAEPFAALLQEHLTSLGIPSVVCLGLYHMDRIILRADLPGDPVSAMVARRPRAPFSVGRFARYYFTIESMGRGVTGSQTPT